MYLAAPRELIVVTRPDVGLRVTPQGLHSLSHASVVSLAEALASGNGALQPLFGISEDLLEVRVAEFTENADARRRWSRYYKLSAPDSELIPLVERLRADPTVETVFVKPGVELPFRSSGRTLVPAAPATVTPDLLSFQTYLEPNRGINAIAAWAKPGGDGQEMQIIDIEGAWRFTHEDLQENEGGKVGGTETPDLFWRNHGTAVIGILSGDRNNGHNVGIIGICPGANISGVSIFGQPTSHLAADSGVAAAIRQAADKLHDGDIMVLEAQAPGPLSDFEIREDQQGYIPVEWWPDNLLAIRYAVERGIIVVEAAGNGGCDLDDPIFDDSPAPPHGPFPSEWRNPLGRNAVDSGAILVGAGAPPGGPNGNFGPRRSRLDFSNFGNSVDAQGWGHEVTSCGFGNLQGIDEDRFYTPDFGGTSAATPMVAGAIASLQGMLRAAGKPLLTPQTARTLLRSTGQEQQDAEDRPRSQRIGNLPDIIQMATQLGL